MRKKNVLVCQQLSKEELSQVEAGKVAISDIALQCPYWDTCPHRYPGCYQPIYAVRTNSLGGCAFAA